MIDNTGIKQFIYKRNKCFVFFWESSEIRKQEGGKKINNKLVMRNFEKDTIKWEISELIEIKSI